MSHNGARVVTPSANSAWLTHGEAAALTDLPLTTIEWWAASKKIQTRPRDLGPTINRASLIAFVAQREADKGKPRPSRPRTPPRPPIQPPSHEWIGVKEASELIDRNTESVSRIARQNGLTMQRSRGRLWLRRDEIESLVADRASWLSWVDASALTGFSPSVIGQAVKAGRIERRPNAHRAQPGLSRSSVETWAAEERLRRAQAAARGEEVRARTEPPHDGHQWLSVPSAARILAVHPTRVRQLIAAGKLPATRKGRRTWLRHDHVEAARKTRTEQPTRH